MDSFIDRDMEDDMAGNETAPGSAIKRRKGPQGRAVHGMPRGASPQAAIQPGATPSGAAIVQSSITRQMPAYMLQQTCLHPATLLIRLNHLSIPFAPILLEQDTSWQHMHLDPGVLACSMGDPLSVQSLN